MKIAIISLLFIVNLLAYDRGDTISSGISSHLGCKQEKIYIVDFFASWCGSCKKELPLISKLNSQLDKNKIEIIGVDVDKSVQKGIEFQNRLKADGNLNIKVINDPQNLVIAEFKPIGMPTLYFIKHNKIIDIITGAVDDIDEVILNKLREME